MHSIRFRFVAAFLFHISLFPYLPITQLSLMFFNSPSLFPQAVTPATCPKAIPSQYAHVSCPRLLKPTGIDC